MDDLTERVVAWKRMALFFVGTMYGLVREAVRALSPPRKFESTHLL